MGKIAFDIDGVLANFTRGFTRIGHRMYGTPVGDSAVQQTWMFEDFPELSLNQEQCGHPIRGGGIWGEIIKSPNFWADLDPFNVSVMPRINAIENKIFITNRVGEDTVAQTQQFLETWGIENPNIVVASKKGPVAIEQNVVAVIDDLYTNIIDIKAAVPSAYTALLWCAYNMPYHETMVNEHKAEIVLSVDHFINTCNERGLITWKTNPVDAKILQHLASLNDI